MRQSLPWGKEESKITKKDKMNILRLDFDTLELSPPFTCGGSSSSPTCTTTDGPLIGWGAKTLHYGLRTMGAMSLRNLELCLSFSLSFPDCTLVHNGQATVSTTLWQQHLLAAQRLLLSVATTLASTCNLFVFSILIGFFLYDIGSRSICLAPFIYLVNHNWIWKVCGQHFFCQKLTSACT